MKKCLSSKVAETMQVFQWILMWEYVKKNCSLKLTNMMSCFNKTADIRATEGEEIRMPRCCQPSLTASLSNHNILKKGVSTACAQLFETILISRTQHSLETIPSAIQAMRTLLD